MMISKEHAVRKVSKSKVKIICTLYQLLMSTIMMLPTLKEKNIMLNSLHLATSMAIKKPLSNYWNTESEFNPKPRRRLCDLR